MTDQLNSAKGAALLSQGYTGDIADQWTAALLDALGETVPRDVLDLESDYLDTQGVAPLGGDPNDRWHVWLGQRGFVSPEHINDRWLRFWVEDGQLGGESDWTIGQSGTTYGYRHTDHPSGPLGDLVPPVLDGTEAWELTVDSGTNLAVLDMGTGGGQQPDARPAYDLDVSGYGRIRLEWSAGSSRYETTDAAFTAYVVGQLGNTLQVRVYAAVAPRAPSVFTASENDASGDVVLSWVPDNALDVDYSIERDGVPDTLTGSTPPPVSDAAITGGYLHTYRVRLSNPYGTGPYSAPDTGWAKAPEAAPQDLTAADDHDAIPITWTDLPAEYVVTQYRVEWATSAGGPWNLLELVAPGVEQAADAGIAIGATRHYRVSAINAAGPGAPSLTDSATRLTLSAPAVLTASDGTVSGGVSLTWTPVAGAHGYRVRRDDVQIAQPSGSPYLDTTAGTGQLYSYTVRAYTATQESGDSPSDTGWHGPPSLAPTNVAATENDPDKVVITWTDLPAGHVVDSYIVSAATQSGGPYDRVVDSVAPGVQTVDDFGLNPAESAWYVVEANNAQGNGPISAEAKGTRYVAPPGQPSTMWASTDKVGIINLSWEHPVTPGADSYNVYRRLSPSGQWEQIATGVTIP